MELRGRRIDFLGDGITQGVGVSSEGRRFPDLIVRQTAPSWPQAMDRQFMTRLDEIPLDADAIVVFGGTNDFGHGDAPLGLFADRKEGAFYSALHLLDLYATSGMQPRVEANRLTYMPDGLHPNDAGRRLLTDRVIARLCQL